jgi:hypothetical protein
MEGLDLDAELEKILGESNAFNNLLAEEVRRNIEDIERVSEVNTGKSDIVKSIRDNAERTKESVRKEITVIEESIPKTKKIEEMIDEKKAAISKIEEGKTLITKMIEKAPEKSTSLTAKLAEYDKACIDKSEKVRELEALKKSVYDKVLKTRASVKDIALRSVKFYEDVEMKARHAIERSVVGLLVKDEIEAQSTDMCFMIDATGSMSTYIKNACDTVASIIDEVKSVYPHSIIRVAIVAYRDIEDHNRFEIFDFSSSSMDAKNFLNGLKAGGGGDGPEDVNGGFQKALKLGWQNSVKSIIHIADAPCHGLKMSGYAGGDSHPEGYREDIPWESIFGDLKKRAMNYLLLNIGSEPKYMFGKFKDIYNSSAHKNEAELIFDMKDLTADKELFKKLTVTHIKDSIASSIKATYTRIPISSKYKPKDGLGTLLEAGVEEEKDDPFTTGKPKSLGLNTEVTSIKADWNNPHFFDLEIEGTSYYVYGATTVKDISNNKFSHNNEKVKLMIKKTPFGKGEFSLAYHCRAKPNNSEVYFNTALKQSIKPAKRDFYFGTLQKNTLAILLAKEYNDALEKAGVNANYRIYFTRVLVVKIKSEYFLLEAFIPGAFEKYTNNLNYVNESVPFMTAFSHFSHEFTKGKFMVTDLQGCNNLLTDPVIHSSRLMFPAQADLGIKGMVAFFRHHECNDFCRKLSLSPHDAQKEKSGPPLRVEAKFNVSPFYKKCNYYFCNENAGSESVCKVCKVKVDPTKAW